MCSKLPSAAAALVDDGLVAAGLGRQRMRDFGRLLQLIDKIPRQ